MIQPEYVFEGAYLSIKLSFTIQIVNITLFILNIRFCKVYPFIFHLKTAVDFFPSVGVRNKIIKKVLQEKYIYLIITNVFNGTNGLKNIIRNKECIGPDMIYYHHFSFMERSLYRILNLIQTER